MILYTKRPLIIFIIVIIETFAGVVTSLALDRVVSVAWSLAGLT